MTTDNLTSALILSMAGNFAVPDLIRTAETLRQNGQLAAIETLYATWIQHNAAHPLLYAVLFNYAVVLSDTGKLELARECLERALQQNQDFLPAHINLGRVLERLGNSAMAVIQWAVALSKMSGVDGASITYKTTALNQSARALEAAGQDDAAENLLRQSLELDNQQREVVQHLIALRQRQCEWPIVTGLERAPHLLQMRGISPLSAAALTDDPLFQLGLAYDYNLRDVGEPKSFMRSWPLAIAAGGRLKIGYLSSDLREHAVGFLMTEVFSLHDRAKVEVFAYYCGPESADSLHQHFKTSVDHFVPISHLDDAAAAQRIAEDGIQILIDLNGYTREARLKLVSMRPAPVIVNWLGYPGTMGSPYHHYIIADEFIIPQTSELYYSEKVLRLPCYQPSSRKRKVSTEAPSRSSVGLPEDAMVYCCFNGAHKLTRFTFERWLMILAKVPHGVLWLLSSIESAHERLRDFAAQRGIARDRIIFADKLPNPAHLARYPLADLFLDTTPYGAHTTASDALWMGVPVLTLAGRSFASRVCGSLATAAGLPELLTYTANEFVDRAVILGNAREQLAPFRERLKATRDTCTLFDMPKLVQAVEALFGQMWQEFLDGRLPRPSLDALDALLELGSRLDHDSQEMQTLDDYHGFWQNLLRQRHAFRPIAPCPRLRTLAPGEFGQFE